MIESIQRELLLRKDYLNNQPISSLYFGGGTPSLIPVDLLAQLVITVKDNFTTTPEAEVTLEANPDDIDIASLEGWLNAGINRLSVGIQSFTEAELKWMNRAHNATQAKQCIPLIREAGFSNFSIDLIYGSPMLHDTDWEAHVQYVIAEKVPHISAYALTIEEKTALAHAVVMGKTKSTDPEKQVRQFEQLMGWLSEAGYDHYEISNYAMPGFQSRHNSSYWQGKHYLGLGPSAHSFNGSSRQWNVANNALYIQSIGQGLIPAELETLTQTQQLNEYIMISLRTREGLSLNRIAQWGPAIRRAIEQDAQVYLQDGRLIQTEDFLQLSRSGKSWADGIAAALFRD